jgi:alkylation response protein AidB-like acyl-CoA dehydrogenase
MKIDLDARQARIVATAAEFARDVLRPRARANDETGVFPRDALRQMGALGLLGATLPLKYGGLELDPLAYGMLVEAVEQGDSAASRLLTVHVALVAEALLRYGSDEQLDRWMPAIARGETLCAFGLTEPEHGSDAAGIQTAYTVHGDEFCLNGRKKWISFSGIADLILIVARKAETVSTFLVRRDTPGLTITPMRGLMAGRACHISELALQDVRVSRDALLGGEGQGFTYVVNTALDHGRYSIAWSGVGLAQAALNAMVAYAKRREQFGSRLSKFELIRAMIADAVTNVYAARSLCLRAAQTRKAGSPEAVTESLIAKQFAAGIALRVACDAVQVHGGNGCCNEYPVERFMREAKILEIIEGTTQIQQLMISLHGLRQYG